MPPLQILIADSQYLARQGLKHLLQSKPEWKVVGEATEEAELMALLSAKKPDLVILDYNQPRYFELETIHKMRELLPEVRVLIISDDTNEQNIYRVLEEGVNSFLTKHCDGEEIVGAIHATAKGEKFFCHNILTLLLEKTFPKDDPDCSPVPLTPREIEIVRLVAQGKIAKEIASELNLSTHTVYTHRKNIMKKLKLSSASELVLYAVNKGIV